MNMRSEEYSDDHLIDLIEKVVDERSFLDFVKALYEDKEKERALLNGEDFNPMNSGPCGWYNDSIEMFLECAHSWAESTGFGDTQDLKGASPWNKFAVFLYMGKIYE